MYPPWESLPTAQKVESKKSKETNPCVGCFLCNHLTSACTQNRCLHHMNQHAHSHTRESLPQQLLVDTLRTWLQRQCCTSYCWGSEDMLLLATIRDVWSAKPLATNRSGALPPLDAWARIPYSQKLQQPQLSAAAFVPRHPVLVVRCASASHFLILFPLFSEKFKKVPFLKLKRVLCMTQSSNRHSRAKGQSLRCWWFAPIPHHKKFFPPYICRGGKIGCMRIAP